MTEPNNPLIEVVFPDTEAAKLLFGHQNEHLSRIAKKLSIILDVRGNTVFLKGDGVHTRLSKLILEQLYGLVKENYPLYPQDIDHAIRILSENDRSDIKRIFLDTVFITAKKRAIAPKTPVQKEYIDAIRTHDMVFGIGPAGTGKTYLAMAMAVSALTQKKISKIILTRPAVEAGEALGFLPGNLSDKVDPYLRPLYDALQDMIPYDKVAEYIAHGAIEVAPLAFMRGRTLNDAFVILDEAQNTTGEQMKMFLTRIGFNSRAVITGDITQTDLPKHKISGLIEAIKILKNLPGLNFVHFSRADVIRHQLVQSIIEAYEKREDRQNQLPMKTHSE